MKSFDSPFRDPVVHGISRPAKFFSFLSMSFIRLARWAEEKALTIDNWRLFAPPRIKTVALVSSKPHNPYDFGIITLDELKGKGKKSEAIKKAILRGFNKSYSVKTKSHRKVKEGTYTWTGPNFNTENKIEENREF